jgi:hypothetical protein
VILDSIALAVAGVLEGPPVVVTRRPAIRHRAWPNRRDGCVVEWPLTQRLTLVVGDLRPIGVRECAAAGEKASKGPHSDSPFSVTTMLWRGAR